MVIDFIREHIDKIVNVFKVGFTYGVKNELGYIYDSLVNLLI